MSRRSKAEEPADPGAEIAVLAVERDRLAQERLFRESAVASLERTVAGARKLLDETCPPILWLDDVGPGHAADRMGALSWLASDLFLQQELERIAKGPRPGYRDVEWSPLTREQAAGRVAEIDERLSVLRRELEIAEAEQVAAEATARAARLRNGEPADPVEVEAEAAETVAELSHLEAGTSDEFDMNSDLGLKA